MSEAVRYTAATSTTRFPAHPRSSRHAGDSVTDESIPDTGSNYSTQYVEDRVAMVATSSPPAHARGLTKAELIRAYSGGDSADPAHVPQPHELRNAWETAKQLEDRLELADQPVLRRIARYVREQVFLELMTLEGYFEVPQQRRRDLMVEPPDA